MTMIQALRSAMDVMMERDDNVVVYGQDVGYFGGVFRVTEGLQAKYGKSRCFDAPISEGGIVGTAVGMGAYGLRPVVEIQFADYFYPASDQIVSEAARLRYRSAGDFTAPITIRMPCGGGIYGGQTHSQSPEALFTHVCGLRTVMPSNPYDAKGLLISSIENDDPVIFLEPKRLYNGPFDGHHDRPVVPWSQHPMGEVPEGYYTVPLESASVFRPGKDLTVLTYGTMVVGLRMRGAGNRHRRRDHRPALDLAAGPADHRRVGQENRPLRRGARSDTHQRLRRRTGVAGAGALLLSPGGADRARGRLGHALSARPGMGLLPRPAAGRRCVAAHDGGLTMASYIIKMPDIGEGIAQVELVAWHVKPGDAVTEDQVLADVMTDKATVEIPSPVAGKIVALGGEVGQQIAVGAELIRLEVEGAGNAKVDAPPAHPRPARELRRPSHRQSNSARQPRRRPPGGSPPSPASERSEAAQPARKPPRASPPPMRDPGDKPIASPAVRRRAWDLGIELQYVHGSGPAGRIMHEDLDVYLASRGQPMQKHGSTAYAQRDEDEAIPVIGLRRKIAQKMQEAKRRIPHFTYVEEVDVTELESLRAQLNARFSAQRGKLTVLPFIARALVLAVRDFPQMNARYDDEGGVVTRSGAVHLGIATQTEPGLMVPVLRHAETHDLWSCAAEVARLAEAARSGKASREQLGGSTITITSLGPLGGIVTTPVINHPEVAIIGINRIALRPVIRDGAVVARQMMNLSCSFDHRVVDGLHAAEFVQAIRALLEAPAMLFVE